MRHILEFPILCAHLKNSSGENAEKRFFDRVASSVSANRFEDFD